MNGDQKNFIVCDDVKEAVRLMRVAASILDGAQEYVASAFLIQALHHLTTSGCKIDPAEDAYDDYEKIFAGSGIEI